MAKHVTEMEPDPVTLKFEKVCGGPALGMINVLWL